MKTGLHYLHALLLLLTCALLISSRIIHGLQEHHNLQLPKEKNPGANFEVLQRVWSISSCISDGFIKLAVTFLHYSVARLLQFKYLPPLPLQPSASTSPSILFWLGFAPAMVGTGNP